jgi:hypothetical protein
MSSERSLITFTPGGGVSLISGINAFLSGLTPLGAIAKTVGEIMACRVEIKRLQNDAQAIRQEYEVKNRQVDVVLQVALQSLEQRRVAIERFFDHADRQMMQQHIWSSQRVRVIQNMTDLISRRGISLEEKILAHETLRAMSKDLIAAQELGSAALSVLVETARQDLLSVPSIKGLLPSGR